VSDARKTLQCQIYLFLFIIFNKFIQFFEDDGRPRRLINGERGCPRKSGNCRFVHPNDPDWSSLPPSAPPPNRYLEFDEDDPNSTDRDQMPRKIPPLLLRHRPFRRSQSPIPPSSPSFSHRGSGGGDRTIDRRDSRVDDDPRTRIRDDRSKSSLPFLFYFSLLFIQCLS